MSKAETQVQDVGHILVKVQNELRMLREKLPTQKDVTAADLEKILAETEEDIKRCTEDVVHHYNNQMQIIPMNYVTDLNLQYLASKNVEKIDKPSNVSNSFMHSGQGMSSAFKLPLRKISQHSSPGLKHINEWRVRTIINPSNQMNRAVMKDTFDIQLPLINDRKIYRMNSKPITGSNVKPLTILPKANRVDATLVPPPVKDEDAKKGIFSLIERGLIPHGSLLTFDPSAIKNESMYLYQPDEKTKFSSQPDLNWAGRKNDTSLKTVSPFNSLPNRPEDRTQSAKTFPRPIATPSKNAKTASVKTFDMQLQPFPPPTTPASGDIRPGNYKLAIQNGKIKDNHVEYLALKELHCHSWGSILLLIQKLEEIMTLHAVPIAFINGKKLVDLAIENELDNNPSQADLLSVIINREDVDGFMNRPGKKFLGVNGKELAAIKIQSCWRRFRERSKYLEYRRLKWAAGVIAMSWIMHIKMAKMRHQLQKSRVEQLDRFKRRAKVFASSWERIKSSHRVVVHIPSLGYKQSIRDSLTDLGLRQNAQMARLCDIKDPKVDVIYISSVPLSDETLQYYSKLLGLHPAVLSSNPDNQISMSDRFTILVPEALKSFSTHHMCLSTLLKYSPRTLKRIKTLIKGREAFIVTGVPHYDDLAVSDDLDLPILCPEPNIAHLYSTKSGSKRIFASANIDTPPSEYDVYSLVQLHECLAQLVTENLEVQRWLFKIDDEFEGRGIAYCDISKYLRCYKWALKEQHRYGEKWTKKWAQESAYIKIHAEIPDILTHYAQPINTKIYPTWELFLQAFLSQGGIIEACPPSDNITTLTVDLLIEPTGVVNLITCGDQIHANSQYSCWGLSIPQTSSEPSVVNAICNRIADACKSRSIVGYLRINLATFIDPKTMDQKIWAIDLCLHYSDNLALFTLLEFVTNGHFQPKTHLFEITLPSQDGKMDRRRMKENQEEVRNNLRYAVMSTHLLHTNLSVVHYSVFFQMCRAHGIGYDIKDRTGTVFTLIDSFNKEWLGMLTVGDSLQSALANFARNLSVIHQEISAPNMQGITNFKDAVTDIENILGTTVENAEESQNSKK